jgi:hypothetical protein
MHPRNRYADAITPEPLFDLPILRDSVKSIAARFYDGVAVGATEFAVNFQEMSSAHRARWSHGLVPARLLRGLRKRCPGDSGVLYFSFHDN